jgi:hypothetical protein
LTGGPLEGIRVIDFTWALAGPYATMILADLGAEVIKVEIPRLGDMTRTWAPYYGSTDVSHYYLSVNRGKEGITLNLKSERGKEIARELIRKSDILVENMVPGTMAKFGLGYDDVKDLNPRLIYASCSGFGQDGPYREAAGVRHYRPGDGRYDERYRRARPATGARGLFHRRHRGRAVYNCRRAGGAPRARAKRLGPVPGCEHARFPGGDAGGRVRPLLRFGQSANPKRLTPSCYRAVSSLPDQRRTICPRRGQRPPVARSVPSAGPAPSARGRAFRHGRGSCH